MWHLNNTLFIFTLVLGTLIALSSSSWFGIINSTNNIYASEAALNYFITQAIASTILLFSVILLSVNFSIQNP